MNRITLHRIHIQEVLTAEPVDAEHTLNFEQFVAACGLDAAWILQLFDHDILNAHENPQQHRFIGDELLRARKAYRLQRDFDASLPAVAVMLDLLEEIHDLRSRLP